MTTPPAAPAAATGSARSRGLLAAALLATAAPIAAVALTSPPVGAAHPVAAPARPARIVTVLGTDTEPYKVPLAPAALNPPKFPLDGGD